MKFTWRDYYSKSHSALVDSWLDKEAKSFTGCDESWNAFHSYYVGESGLRLNENYWCKVIYYNDHPFAIIALSLYNSIFTIMEYVVSPEKRCQGFGSAALTELLENSDLIIGNIIKRAEAVIFPNNIASQRAFEKAGFVFDHAHPDGDAWYYTYNSHLC